MSINPTILRLREGILHAEASDYREARRIVSPLASELDMDYGGEIAFNLLRLYIFINRRLADAISGDGDGAQDALRILNHILNAYLDEERRGS